MTRKKKVDNKSKRMMSIKVSNSFYEEFDKFCKEYGFTKSGFMERAAKKLMDEFKSRGIETIRD